MGKVWKWVRKVLLGLGIFVLLITGLSFFIAWKYESEIISLAVDKLNQNLAVPVNFGKGHLSFWKSFPQASIWFEDVKIHESTPGSKENVAELGYLGLSFNPMDLYSGKYEVHRIELRKGLIHIKRDAGGIGNYLVWKQVDSTAKSKTNQKLNLSLKDIRMEDIDFSYNDALKKLKTSTFVKKARFSGSLSSDIFDLKADGDFGALSFQAGKVNYIRQKDVTLASLISVDLANGNFGLAKCSLAIGKAGFDAKGTATKAENGTLLDFTIKAKEAEMHSFMALVPSMYSHYLEKYESRGKFQFDFRLSGLINKTSNPGITAHFEMKDGYLLEKGNKLALENLRFKGLFTNGLRHRGETSQIKIEGFHARIKGKDLAGGFQLDNFPDPRLQLALAADVDLKDVQTFMPQNGIKEMSGLLGLNIAFKGRINDLKSRSTAAKTHLSGELSIKDVSIIPDSLPIKYTGLNGNFQFDGNNLDIKDFAGMIASSDFKLNGRFNNLASFIFLPGQKLDVNARLESKNVHLDDFLVNKTSGKGRSKDSTTKSLFPTFLLADLQLDIKNLTYNHFIGSNISGRAKLRTDELSLTNLKCTAMDGHLAVDGRISKLHSPQFLTNAKVQLEGINIEKLFAQLDNFGQNFITDRHLKGKMQAKIELSCNWSKNMEADLGSLAANAELKIEKGELNHLEPLVEVSNYMHIKRLDNLKFSVLSNTITIHDKMIYVPEMLMKSNMVNLTIAGTHTFDNIMDYRLKVNVSHLFLGKQANYMTEFGEVKVDEDKGINVHLTMKGPAAHPIIKHDGQGLKQTLTADLKKQKQEIKDIFKKKKESKPTPANESFALEDGTDPVNSEEKAENKPVEKKKYGILKFKKKPKPKKDLEIQWDSDK